MTVLKKGRLSDVDLWEGLVAFVQLGLIGGFWFQVGSHPCRQGDSGARGKTSSPPMCDHPHIKFGIYVSSLFVIDLKKKKKRLVVSLQPSLFLFVIEISMFVEIHVFLSYFGFSIPVQQHFFVRIGSSPAVVHGMTPMDKKNKTNQKQQHSLVLLDCT